MRTINQATAFRRDFKGLKRSPRHRDIDRRLGEVLALLAADGLLAERYKDHGLIGEWQGYRDCHVKPDLVLIYRKVGRDILELVRLGTHSELFQK